jgi:hypothetical protein
MFVVRTANRPEMESRLKSILELEITRYDNKFKQLEEFFDNNDLTREARLLALNETFEQVTDVSIPQYIKLLKKAYETDPDIKTLIDSVIATS